MRSGQEAGADRHSDCNYTEGCPAQWPCPKARRGTEEEAAAGRLTSTQWAQTHTEGCPVSRPCQRRRGKLAGGRRRPKQTQTLRSVLADGGHLQGLAAHNSCPVSAVGGGLWGLSASLVGFTKGSKQRTGLHRWSECVDVAAPAAPTAKLLKPAGYQQRQATVCNQTKIFNVVH